MKVLIIDVNYKHSSTGKIVDDLFQSLTRKGNEVTVCYGRGPNIKAKNVYKFGIDLETRIHALLTRITGLMGYYSPFSTKRLINKIKETKPDIIHIHELHSYFVNVIDVLEFINQLKIPIVYTFHCEFMYTGKCGYTEECIKWKTCCQKCPKIKEYPKSLYIDRTKKMFLDKKKILTSMKNVVITVPSPWLAERVKQSFCGNKDIKVIYNGVDTNTFSYQNFDEIMESKFHGKKIILSIAPNIMDNRKGGKHVLELAKQSVEHKDWHFILIGVNNPKKFKNIGSNVTLIGPIFNQNLLAKYYSMANFFLLCSFRETFSMTCAEAISCGTKVVGFESGAPETIFSDEYATFYPYGDINSIKKHLENNMEQNTDKRANEMFSNERMCHEFESLYKSLLNDF